MKFQVFKAIVMVIRAQAPLALQAACGQYTDTLIHNDVGANKFDWSWSGTDSNYTNQSRQGPNLLGAKVTMTYNSTEYNPIDDDAADAIEDIEDNIPDIPEEFFFEEEFFIDEDDLFFSEGSETVTYWWREKNMDVLEEIQEGLTEFEALGKALSLVNGVQLAERLNNDNEIEEKINSYQKIN